MRVTIERTTGIREREITDVAEVRVRALEDAQSGEACKLFHGQELRVLARFQLTGIARRFDFVSEPDFEIDFTFPVRGELG